MFESQQIDGDCEEEEVDEEEEASPLEDILNNLTEDYLSAIDADSFLELQRAEPEPDGASYKPWLREVGAKLLLRIMDRVFDDLCGENNQLAANQKEYLEEKNDLESQLSKLRETNENLMQQIKRMENAQYPHNFSKTGKKVNREEIEKGVLSAENIDLLSATNLVDVANCPDTNFAELHAEIGNLGSNNHPQSPETQPSLLGLSPEKPASPARSRLAHHQRKRKCDEDDVNIFKKRGKGHIRSESSYIDDVSFVPETLAIDAKSVVPSVHGKDVDTVIPDTPEKSGKKKGSLTNSPIITKQLNSNTRNSKEPQVSGSKETRNTDCTSPIMFRTRLEIPGMEPPADGLLRRVAVNFHGRPGRPRPASVKEIIDNVEFEDDVKRSGDGKAVVADKPSAAGKASKADKPSTAEIDSAASASVRESAKEHSKDALGRKAENRPVVNQSRLGRATIEDEPVIVNKTPVPGIISPRKQLLEDRNSWKQIHEDFGQAKSIVESDSDFESPNLLKIESRRSRLEAEAEARKKTDAKVESWRSKFESKSDSFGRPRVEPEASSRRSEAVADMDARIEADDDIQCFYSPPDQPINKLSKAAKLARKEPAKLAKAKSGSPKASPSKNHKSKIHTVSVTPKKKTKLPKKYNSLGIEVEEITSSHKKRLKRMKQSHIDVYLAAKGKAGELAKVKKKIASNDAEFNLAIRNSMKTLALETRQKQPSNLDAERSKGERRAKERVAQAEPSSTSHTEERPITVRNSEIATATSTTTSPLKPNQTLTFSTDRPMPQIPGTATNAKPTIRPATNRQNEASKLSTEKENVAYKYVGAAVRKKEERAKLKGFDCYECRDYYAAKLEEGYTEEEVAKLMNECSKHRARYRPPLTPPNFWDPEIIEGDPDDPRNKTQQGPPLRTRALRRKEAREKRKQEEAMKNQENEEDF